MKILRCDTCGKEAPEETRDELLIAICEQRADLPCAWKAHYVLQADTGFIGIEGKDL